MPRGHKAPKNALQRVLSKTPVAARLTSKEWGDVPLALRERAQLSARVDDLQVTQGIQDLLTDWIKQDPEKAFQNRGRFVRDMRVAMGAPPPEEGQSLISQMMDITSERRLGLIYDFQTQDAYEYGRWKMGNDPDVIDEFPAQELVRAAGRKVPRDWVQRWTDAGGELVDGRMIALKSDPIWRKISAFGRPWPPFDFGSGMGLDDVSIDEAIDFGLMREGDKIESGEKGFNDDLEASVKGLSGDKKAWLRENFGDQIKVRGDTARWSDTADAGNESTCLRRPGRQVPGWADLANRAGVDEPPTDAQKKSGNYKKAHISVHGLDISVENPKGSIRTGTSKDGTRWESPPMPAHYGYAKRTEGADGDHLDVFVGPEHSDRVWVIDQHDLNGDRFDEHKVMLDFPDREAALSAYDGSFSDGKGPARRKAVTETSVDEFKRWLDEEDTTLPFGDMANAYNPDQTRVPSGSSEGGQFGSVGGMPAASVSPLEGDSGALTSGSGERIEPVRLTSSKAISEYAQKHFPAGNEFDAEEVAGLNRYAGSTFSRVNNGLRANAGDIEKVQAKKTVAALDKAIQRGTVPEDVVVYRGINSSTLANKFSVGDEFQDHGFVSTSLDKKIGEKFGKEAVLEITVPKDAKALAFDSIYKGGHMDEHELLLPRGSKFRVTDVSRRKGKYEHIGGKKGKYVIKMELVTS